jgi:hypothetical protein
MKLILILFTMKKLINNLSVQTYNHNQVELINTESLMDLPGSANTDINFQHNVLSANTDTNFQPNVLPNSLDVEVQTKSLWKLFKISLKKIICINSSDIDRTPQVENMMNNLNPSQEIIAKVYDIMDSLNFGLAISQPNAIFDHAFLDGVDQYFISYSNTLLSVNPELINCFL